MEEDWGGRFSTSLANSFFLFESSTQLSASQGLENILEGLMRISNIEI
jgi:hypothetical protein